MSTLAEPQDPTIRQLASRASPTKMRRQSKRQLQLTRNDANQLLEELRQAHLLSLMTNERLLLDEPGESSSWSPLEERNKSTFELRGEKQQPHKKRAAPNETKGKQASGRTNECKILMMRTRMSRSARLLPLLAYIICSALTIATGQLSESGESLASNLVSRQLLRSADVELSRRSLQRQQREAGDSTPATCGYPGSPAHASVTFNTSHVVAGTAASYTCDNGYELLGPPRRICQPNGSWSPVGIPFCVLNVGLGKAAMQSSTAGHGSAQKAVDGSTSPYFQANTCTMTDVEHNPWWYVNLLEPYLVQIVRIDFGTACCANRQKATIAVRVGNNRPDLGTNPLCNRYHGFIEEGKPLFLPCTRPAPGAFVSIHLESPSGSSLSICETFIYTDHALSIEQCPSFRDQPLGSTATYNGKCYLFHNNQALNFEGARKYCESRGGTLVDETSPALQGFLSWELYRRHRNDQLMGQYWLGAVRDTRNTQNWKWINGRDVQISFWNSLAAQGNCSRFDGSKGWLWSDTDCQAQLNFICQYRPLSCGKPEKPTNSTLVTRNIDNGTVIEYQCAAGNLLMGPKSRVCLPTGFFSEFAPKCKYLDCQFPAMIANGDYKLLNGTTAYQSVVTYFCNDSYQLYGRPTLTCDVDERWNGPPPRCEPLLCPAPVAPSNGYVTVTSNITTPGTQATYDCRPNYELVGDRLLSCLPSGSWDNSFPYCRERRQVSPAPPVASQMSAPSASKPAPAGQNRATVGRESPAPPAAPPEPPAKPQPPPGGLFSSNRLAASVTQQPLAGSGAPQATSASTTPASLNGLAGQFVTPAGSNQAATSAANQTPSSEMATSVSLPPPPSEQNSRRPAQSTSFSSFGQLPSSSPPPSPPPQPSIQVQNEPAIHEHRTPLVGRPHSPSASRAPTWPVAARPLGQQQASAVPTAIGGNKITQQQPAAYDSSPLATTNSISVHSSSSSSLPGSSSAPPATLAGSSSSTAASPTTFSSATATSQTPSQVLPASSQVNVLASLAAGNSLRANQPGTAHQQQHHNSLANAKYSLDGIIAVAIFGGFIFLGAIITILVIIIRRRKSGRSSSIDAQTISTYDSNGAEHNGLYRNYQQAWENLRFAGPGSQPKSSGGNSGSSGTGADLLAGHHHHHQLAGQLKSYASPGGLSAAAVLHHAHPAQAAGNPSGHHNLAMSSASTTSSSSQSSGSLAVTGPAGSGGADPLLGPHHHHHNHSHHHMHAAGRHALQQQQQAELLHRHHHAYHMESDDEAEEDEDDEQGVISADEANHPNHHLHIQQQQHQHQRLHLATRHPGHQEGFRDTNELTINADTATLASSVAAATSGLQAANRRHLYSTNSMSRSQAQTAAAANRRSTGDLAHQQQQAGRQIVSGSSASNSTRSSRASPAGDEHSLDRLAYGSNWHNHHPAGNQ